MTRKELSIVIPVFNEEDNIESLFQRWQLDLKQTDILFEFIFINDGSTDKSLTLLSSLAKTYDSVKVFTQKNSGHGVALRQGYNLALTSEWVFQLDADSQYTPTAFLHMWKNRENYDLLIGSIPEKKASIARRLISKSSVMLVKILCRKSFNEINTPYRLMRSSDLINILPKIPPQSFAINIMLSMYYLSKGMRIFSTPLNELSRQKPRKSKLNKYIFTGALLSFFQIIQFRSRL